MEDRLMFRASGPLRGEISVPGDKSISHRALMLSAIAEGESVISNLLAGQDVICTRRAFERMGVKIEGSALEGSEGPDIKVAGVSMRGLKEPDGPIDMGNSGTAMRLLSGILAGQNFSSELVGDESLSKRPMKRIMDPLTSMGARISGTEKGTPPLKIQGSKLKGISYKSPIASAQVKSCVLLAGLYAEGETEVIEPLKSRDHTERMLRSLGALVEEQGTTVRLRGGQSLSASRIEVPGDISSAAFLIVAGLIVPGSEIRIRRVGVNPTRTGVLDILEMMGARVNIENRASMGDEPVADIVVRSSDLKGVTIGKDIVPRMIDEFPILAAAASLAEGKTEISGAEDLRVKESDRISSVTQEFKKMGAKIEEKPDGMIIEGVERLKGTKVHSHGDHRLAMALSIAALVAGGETRIEGTKWIDTSFPGFLKKIKQLLA